jgi:hypothetical protein
MSQLVLEADAVNRQFLQRLTSAQGQTLRSLLQRMVEGEG